MFIKRQSKDVYVREEMADVADELRIVLLQLMVSGQPIQTGPSVTLLVGRATRSDRGPALTLLRRMAARIARDRDRRRGIARRNCLVPVSLRLTTNTSLL